MNSDLDRQFSSQDNNAQDGRIMPKLRQQKAFAIRGSGGGRLISLGFRRVTNRHCRADNPHNISSSEKGDWVCQVCSYQNDSTLGDDCCFRCRFQREKTDDKPVSLMLSPRSAKAKKTPGAYEVIEKGNEQKVRPVQRDLKFLRKAEPSQPRKGGSGEINVNPSDFTATGSAGNRSAITPRVDDIYVPTTASGTISPKPQRSTTKQTGNTSPKEQITPPRVTRKVSPKARPSPTRKQSGSPFRELHRASSSPLSLPPKSSKHYDEDDMEHLSKSSSMLSASHTHQYEDDAAPDLPDWSYEETPSDQEQGPWECQMCTYINDNAIHLTCAVCGNRRDATVSDVHSPDGAARTSIYSGQAQLLEDTQENLDLKDAEEIQRVRMNELIMMQFELLAELKQDQGDSEEPPQHEAVQQLPRPRSVRRSTTETRSSLSEITRQLSELASVNEEERREQQQLLELQEKRRREIIEKEGLEALPEKLSPSRPGLTSKSISKQALTWVGQQQMLNEWQDELDWRDERLEEIRRQQEDIMRQIQKNPSSGSSGSS